MCQAIRSPGLNNLTNNGSTRKFTDFFPENTGRVDYNINETTRMFVRYSRNALQEERSFHYSTNSAINPADTGKNNPFTRENHNATIQFTQDVQPDDGARFPRRSRALQIGERRRSRARQSVRRRSASPRPSSSQAANWFPEIHLGQLRGRRSAAHAMSVRSRRPTRFRRSLAKSLGRHNMKFGGEFRLIRGYSQTPGLQRRKFLLRPDSSPAPIPC